MIIPGIVWGIPQIPSQKIRRSAITLSKTKLPFPRYVVSLLRAQSQNFWQIFLLSSACTLECSTTPSSLSFSFVSISFSSLTIFFSIPQAAENSPFSSFLSSLAYLLSLLDWPLGTLIWPVCHSLFFPYLSSSIRSSAQLVLILCFVI